MMRNLVLFGFLFRMTSAISLVEILFKNNIKDARCQAQCLDVETMEQRTRCVGICRELEASPQYGDLCSLSSECTEGCLEACEARTASSIGVKITEARMETCDLSWDLASDTEEDVVFVVAGRDKAGMWSLITDSLTLTSLAVRMEEVMLFAVTRSELEDRGGPNTGEHQQPALTLSPELSPPYCGLCGLLIKTRILIATPQCYFS